jgi:hypothetical protein
MARVEWSRSAPEDVETLVAIMLHREFPQAVRIRPSQGDRGMDILVPEENTAEVYQIKYFSSNLGAAQKRQICDSYRQVMDSISTEGILADTGGRRIAAWHLVMPLDPTRENLKWLDQLTSDAIFPCHWKGLAYLDGLAAKYPDVIDYYLRDGKDRLSAHVRELTRHMGLTRESKSTAQQVTPAGTTQGLRDIYQALNRYDPHYRYEFLVTQSRPDLSQPSGRIVGAVSSVSETECVTHLVYARFDAAAEYAAVPISLSLTAEPGSDFEQAWKETLMYGTPLEVPEGNLAKFDIGLPGDLGAAFEGGGKAWFGPVRPLGAQRYVLRLRLVDRTGQVIGQARLNMEPVTSGLAGSGMRAFGREVNRVFAFEMRYDPDGQTTFKVSGEDLQGKLATDVLQGLEFMEHFQYPNMLQVAGQVGPFSKQSIPLPRREGSRIPPEVQIIRALAIIQEQTSEHLPIPDFEELTREAGDYIIKVARLLRGETIRGHWKSVVAEVPSETIDLLRNHPLYQFSVTHELEFMVRDKVIKLGHIVTDLPVVSLDEARPIEKTSAGMWLAHLVPGGANELETRWLGLTEDEET